MIRIFVGIKQVYFADYQRLLCNAKNKHFSSTNDHVPANIGCIYGQNSPFVEFVRNVSAETYYVSLSPKRRASSFLCDCRS